MIALHIIPTREHGMPSAVVMFVKTPLLQSAIGRMRRTKCDRQTRPRNDISIMRAITLNYIAMMKRLGMRRVDEQLNLCRTVHCHLRKSCNASNAALVLETLGGC